ncbi:Uncharacterised protein [Bordetella pertussis]|nr:Uncharacterised protein [Bordetella pertussis]CFO67549.1 Uncharacterised protein [Bordetella pertussis]CPH79410.1 Uncharacterised protein [Bordetella pertussis]CPO22671.1 Uncharacterised protein [Bordetella pertussis]
MKGSDGAGEVSFARPLDLDDLGAEQPEQPCAVGAGEHMGDVEDFEASQRLGRCRLCKHGEMGDRAP